MGHVSLNEGWLILEYGISKLRRMLDGCRETRFSTEEYMGYYECVYVMGSQRDHHCRELYERYELTLEESIISQVLPHLMHNNDEVLLQQLVKVWSDYKSMVKILLGIFNYIDRYYTVRSRLPSLSDVAINCFCRQIFPMLNERLIYAINSLINREREGQRIDTDLLKNVSGLLLDVGEGLPHKFGQAIAGGCFVYYSQKAAELTSQFCLSNYALKVQECLDKENSRLLCYFSFISEHKRHSLLEEIQKHLMAAFQNRLNSDDKLGTYQELSDKCAMLTIGDVKNSVSASYMEME